MTTSETLRSGEKQLVANDIDPNDALILLAHTFKSNKEFILSHPEKDTTEQDGSFFDSLIKKRIEKYPVAMLIGYKYFYGLKFIVSKDTLIPTPETELLVDEVLKIAEKKKNPAILDLGTGSGNIIISIANHLKKNAVYYATDISKKALKIAKKNALVNCVSINFKHSNLFSHVPKTKFDIITANLPYLTTAQLSEPSISKIPIEALWGGTSGVDLYKELFTALPHFIAEQGALLIEIDPYQKDAIENLASNLLPEFNISFLTDLQNLVRVAILQKSN